MKILFITKLYYPHIGGVEKHIEQVSKKLVSKNHQVIILTERYDVNLKAEEVIGGVKIIRFSYPHIKFLGLLLIWWKIFLRKKLITDANVVHVHDVFIWYLPFRILLPLKKIVTTIHGWEEMYPIRYKYIFMKRLANFLSSKTVVIGKYVEKYYRVTSDLTIYGATNKVSEIAGKRKIKYIYVGRLDESTGLLEFINWLKKNKQTNICFIGDGNLRKVCEKYGKVTGFCDPNPYYKTAEYVVPGGYLAALEGLSYNCKLKLFWNNKVKEDYWKMSPFYQLKGIELKKWTREQTWDKLADEYLYLYNHIK